MAKKREPEDGRKNTVAREPDPREARWLDRRSFLMSAGKYSAAAAGLLAGAPTLFSGCFFGKSDDDQSDAKPIERYQQEAVPAIMDADTGASLSDGEDAVYEISIEQAGDYMLTVSSESTLPEADAVRAFLLEEDGDVIWWEDIRAGATYTEGWEGLHSGIYYLVIESQTDSVKVVFTVTEQSGSGEGGTGGSGEGGTGGTGEGGSGEGGTGEGGSGEGGTGEGGTGEGGSGEWDDYSDWVDSAWTNNTWSDSSGWKDAGSGTWVAYSDSWYAGEWDDGWLNYGYY